MDPFPWILSSWAHKLISSDANGCLGDKFERSTNLSICSHICILIGKGQSGEARQRPK